MTTVYHWCLVPECTNTSVKTPQKLWIQLPSDIKMRNTWLKLARRNPKSLSTKTRLYLCEDHFHLENDMENYTEYKIMGSVKRIRMKPNCVPSRFDCQANKRPKSSSSEPQHQVCAPHAFIKKESMSLSEEIEGTINNEHYEPISTSDEIESTIKKENYEPMSTIEDIERTINNKNYEPMSTIEEIERTIKKENEDIESTINNENYEPISTIEEIERTINNENYESGPSCSQDFLTREIKNCNDKAVQTVQAQEHKAIQVCLGELRSRYVPRILRRDPVLYGTCQQK